MEYISNNKFGFYVLSLSALVSGNGTKYNANYVDKTYARVDTASTPRYFAYKVYVS